MLTLTRGPSRDSALNAAVLNRPTPSNPSTSFAQQLADSLESYLSQASAGSHLEIDILPSQGNNSATRQFLVTVTGPNSLGGTSTLPAVSTPGSDGTVMSGLMDRGGIPAAVAAPADPPTAAAPAAPTNEVDAYWASQPKEVQVLRTIQDWDERAIMGQKLAAQGFVIDPNIMLHGWDPYMTMKIRQGEGYTWVPAVGQDGIPVAPGLNFPGLPSYDPNHPPPGSVLVSTDFAVGLENTSPGAWSTNFSNSAQS
jgi:hypothetical protein